MTSHVALVEREADVYVVSEQAALLAGRAGFDRYACGDIETAVSEICSNAIRHADGGWAAIRHLPDRFEVSVTDTGPGFEGPRKSSPGLGIGLEGARRLMDSLEVTTVPGGSRVTLLRRLPTRQDPSVSEWSVEAAFRTRSGQAVCGDEVRVEQTRDTIRVGVADGLGSGMDASLAAQAALEGMELSSHDSPAESLLRAHSASRHTRGAAAAIVHIDSEGRGIHSGLGDVSCRVLGETHIPSRPGMVGHGTPEPSDSSFRLPADGAVLLWSDGLRQADAAVAGQRHLPRRGLSGLEGVVREHGNPRQDATVVMIRRAM